MRTLTSDVSHSRLTCNGIPSHADNTKHSMVISSRHQSLNTDLMMFILDATKDTALNRHEEWNCQCFPMSKLYGYGCDKLQLQTRLVALTVSPQGHYFIKLSHFPVSTWCFLWCSMCFSGLNTGCGLNTMPWILASRAVSSNSVRGSTSTPMNDLPMTCNLKGHAYYN